MLLNRLLLFVVVNATPNKRQECNHPCVCVRVRVNLYSTTLESRDKKRSDVRILADFHLLKRRLWSKETVTGDLRCLGCAPKNGVRSTQKDSAGVTGSRTPTHFYPSQDWHCNCTTTVLVYRSRNSDMNRDDRERHRFDTSSGQ
jgi:hypothetical protein